jgi:hypothetical protein
LQATVCGPHTPATLHSPLAMYCWRGSAGQAVMVVVQLVRCSQPPAPSQLPLAPQAPVGAAAHDGGLVARAGVPAGMFEQTPALPDSLQLAHPPAQTLSQQTPSAEQTSPLPQSLFATQDSPAASLSPQRFVVCRQVSPPVQSAFVEQVLRQVGLALLHM